MGIGDEILAAGEARKLHKSNGLPVVIVDRWGRPRWSEMWEGVPYIVRRPGGKPVSRLLNCPGHRPYIAGKTVNNWTWKAYKPTPAEIVFTPADLAFAEPYRGMVMIEPNVKANGHDNKAWIASRWDELLDRIELPTVQCLAGGTRPILATKHVLTLTFRQAAAVLSVARAFIGTEGGLHHAAAAVDTPAVVLFGGFISPTVTGYSAHRNLFTGSGLGCGARINCAHCRGAMEAITVEKVIRELQTVLSEN